MNTARGHVPVHAKAISYNVDGTGNLKIRSLMLNDIYR